MAGTVDALQLSLTHSIGCVAKSSTACVHWDSLRGSSRSMPGGLRNKQAREPGE